MVHLVQYPGCTFSYNFYFMQTQEQIEDGEKGNKAEISLHTHHLVFTLAVKTKALDNKLVTKVGCNYVKASHLDLPLGTPICSLTKPQDFLVNLFLAWPSSPSTKPGMRCWLERTQATVRLSSSPLTMHFSKPSFTE